VTGIYEQIETKKHFHNSITGADTMSQSQNTINKDLLWEAELHASLILKMITGEFNVEEGEHPCDRDHAIEIHAAALLEALDKLN